MVLPSYVHRRFIPAAEGLGATAEPADDWLTSVSYWRHSRHVVNHTVPATFYGCARHAAGWAGALASFLAHSGSAGFSGGQNLRAVPPGPRLRPTP